MGAFDQSPLHHRCSVWGGVGGCIRGCCRRQRRSGLLVGQRRGQLESCDHPASRSTGAVLRDVLASSGQAPCRGSSVAVVEASTDDEHAGGGPQRGGVAVPVAAVGVAAELAVVRPSWVGCIDDPSQPVPDGVGRGRPGAAALDDGRGISRHESGRVTPGLGTLVCIAEALDVSLDSLAANNAPRRLLTPSRWLCEVAGAAGDGPTARSVLATPGQGRLC